MFVLFVATAVVGGGRMARGVGSPGGPTSFRAMAGADGIRVGVSAPNFLVVEDLVDVGAPFAQATLDSLGTADGLAAAPYPGPTTLAVGPTLAGSGVPVPPYPLIAASDPQHPQKHVDGAGYSLAADTSGETVSARALSGGESLGDAVGGMGSEAKAFLANDGSSVTAEAKNWTTGFSLPSLVTIGSVSSSATVVSRPGQAAHRSDTLSVEGLFLLGVPVGVTRQGLVVGGASVPLPLDEILRRLGAYGITIAVLAPVETADGVTAPGLEMSYVVSAPGAAKAVTTIVFGRAMAQASIAGGSMVSNSGSGLGVTGAAGNNSGPQLGSGRVPTAPSTQSSGIPIDGGVSPGITSAGASDQQVPLGRPAGNPVGYREFPVFPGWSLYLVIVIGAFAGVGSVQLVRLFGVRLWISRRS